MIEASGLTMRYGKKIAVDDVTFTVHPGRVTGFLGPNGAGKSTTMRLIVGLDHPTRGTVTVNGRRYDQHRAPMQEVGSLLDAKAVHTGRSAYNHLLAMGATHGIGKTRVREVIEMTGLETVAKKRVGGFSLGMGQRLGIASALLGDPHTLILDEPVNGLDPEDVRCNPWSERFERVSSARVTFRASPSRSMATSPTSRYSSWPFGPFTRTADPSIVTSTPLGTVIVCLPIRDIGQLRYQTWHRISPPTRRSRASRSVNRP